MKDLDLKNRQPVRELSEPQTYAIRADGAQPVVARRSGSRWLAFQSGSITH